MHYQDQVIRMTKSAAEGLFRAARAMPPDKLTWKVLDKGRSALDLLRECAQSPSWFAPMLKHQAPPPEFTKDDMAAAQQQREQWKSATDCEKACKDSSETLYAVIKSFPDKDLAKEIKLPWGENFIASMADIAMFQYWNLVYHLGQVNFIQTLYGDKDMH
ncbi:MAG TPA: hypothetical protein VIL47_06555 [Candidatus Bipolaricaulota bacterium]